MKRLFDIVVSLFLLAVLSPVLLVIAILIRVTMGSPVCFCQVRPGFRAKPFRVVKFRTMNDARDGHGELLPDGERLTELGRLLRRFSLDELPQMWNVLRGEMSLVGPRPLLMEYLDRYTPEQARRHDVKPGITGWAQVNGRNAITWEEKFQYDLWYVDHHSIAVDLRIILLTLRRALQGSGVSWTGHATAPKFTGTPGAHGIDSSELKS